VSLWRPPGSSGEKNTPSHGTAILAVILAGGRGIEAQLKLIPQDQ